MSDTALLDQLLDPFSQCLDAESARRVIEFGIAPAVQERVNALGEKANEGVLTDDERTDYEALIDAADFIAILKLKARRQLIPNTRPRRIQSYAIWSVNGPGIAASIVCSGKSIAISRIILNISSLNSMAAPTIKTTWR